ncbi:MAG: hypothetical protein IJY43_02430 [Clostridia bacterium]|nr:hypothetical protein [Clostridia bacterium]
MMGILGEIRTKQKHFTVGGREILCIDAAFPCGNSPAAAHILQLVQALCAYAERELLTGATDALMRAVGAGQGHRFTKWRYRIALSEAPAGRGHRVTVAVCFSFFDTQAGQCAERFYQLDTFWDAQGVIQMAKRREKRKKSRKTEGKMTNR